MKRNNSTTERESIHSDGQAGSRLATLLIILIVVQFYIVPLVAIAAGKDLTRYRDYLYLYSITSYTIIVIGIIVFHSKGLPTLQDHYSLWIIVIACLVAASPAKTNAVYRIFLVLLALRLSAHVVVNRKNFAIPSLKSVFIGLLWAIGTVFVTALLLAFLNPASASLPENFWVYLQNTLIFQIAFVTVIEEACFRGLLFGLLRINGYAENTALFIQGILFWGTHYLKIPNLSLFFLAIPLLTLATTLAIKKYKMLYLSVMIHTVANVVGPVLVAFIMHSR